MGLFILVPFPNPIHQTPSRIQICVTAETPSPHPIIFSNSSSPSIQFCKARQLYIPSTSLTVAPALSILHILLRFRTRRASSPTRRRPTSWRRLVLQRHSSPTAIHHCHDIRAVLQGLCEIADTAYDVFVAVGAERDDGDKAKGEPWVSFDDPRCVVALVRYISYAFPSSGRSSGCWKGTGLTQLWHWHRTPSYPFSCFENSVMASVGFRQG